jgi:nicotinate-nucleotide adenylyltransferase
MGQRVGVFGGAFDPPHHAHVALAQAAFSQLKLDALHILPTGNAWHKSRDLTAPVHRLAMCHLAFDALPGVVINPLELNRAGPSYTVDTLHDLQAASPGNKWFLLIGADQARDFKRWKAWSEILRLATLVVADRNPEAGQWHNRELAQALHLQMPVLPISATDIRDRLRQKLPVAPLVPESILRYIDQHDLYAHHP